MKFVGGWMPYGPYERDKSDPFGWRPPIEDGWHECAVHSWSSTNPDKDCPYCVKEQQDAWPFS